MMQKTLLFIYSVLLFKSFAKVKSIYFDEYSKEQIFFANVENILKTINERKMKIYFVTKNKQNESIFTSQLVKKYIKNIRLVVGRKGFLKYQVYKKFIKGRKYGKEDIIIIGDNFFDDIVPAMLLGVNSIWCNMYNCKLKSIVCKCVKIFCKKVKS